MGMFQELILPAPGMNGGGAEVAKEMLNIVSSTTKTDEEEHQ